MKNNNINVNLRYNLLITLVYFVGIILIFQLFRLQIIHGDEYRETSNSRLTRESTIEAARGNIEDRNGVILATTKTGYSVELYKTKCTNEELNQTILKVVNLLENNGDTYSNNFPINSECQFTYTTENLINNWKKTYKIEDSNTAEECIEKFKRKYEITNENKDDVLKIIAIRYEITMQGYSTTKSVKIAQNISKESAIQFNEQNLQFPGINVIEEPIREYTKGTLAAHIIGYLGKIDNEEYNEKSSLGYKVTDYIGKVGIEYVLEKYLRGTNGQKQIDMSVNGTIDGEYVVEEAISGDAVTLTIDANMQQEMENVIEDAVNNSKNSGNNTDVAAAVLMNVKSGEVLAMCSYPTYSPQIFVNGISNKEWKDINEGRKLYNNAVQSANAPGSTFKMVVATAALEEEFTTENEQIYDRGVYPYGHNPVCWYYTQNHTGHGNVNIKTAIQKSCNYYFYEMGRRLGVDKIAEYAEFYGLGQKTGIELTGETTGTVASTKEASKRGEIWYPSQTLSAAIGQSYNNYSVIQMAKYISIVANGGNYITPTLIKEIKNVNGSEESKEEIKEYVNKLLGVCTEKTSELEVSQETVNIVKEGMRLVTAKGGTAHSIFKDFDKSVAGKTGSAQAKTSEKGEITNSWFVGFTPYENSEVAIAVYVEDGASGSYAAQAAKRILEAYYNLDIKQTDDLAEDMSAKIYVQSEY